MISPLSKILTHALLEWTPGERGMRLLKWAEAFSGVLAAYVLTRYLDSPRVDPKIEKSVRALSSPAFGAYVSVLQLSVNFFEDSEIPYAAKVLHARYESKEFPKLADAISLLQKRIPTINITKKPPESLQLLEVLLAVRNRVSHGVLTEDVVQAVEEICNTLGTTCEKTQSPRFLVIQEIKASTESPGKFIERGILCDGPKESRWEETKTHEDVLRMKALYFFDRTGQPVIAPPFLQVDQGYFWFLQKYRGGGSSHFTDFRTSNAKTDPFWDGYLREFFEERFERSRQGVVQLSSLGIIHNLPPERDLYPQFVGRVDDLSKLAERLKPNIQTHIVALGGLGGVGKTALARSFVQSVVEGQTKEPLFDYVVWVSAKMTVLREEVEPLSPGIQDIDDVLDEIARVAESPELIYLRPFERKRDEILVLLESQRFLLIVDNFETIKRKDAFWEFLLSIPRPSKVLVTSRETFAEGCLTIQVPELSGSEALQVFANECRNLGFDPTSLLANKKSKEIIDRSGGIPLALKHVAILVHRGASLDDALERLRAKAGPIADFCFRGTFGVLNKPEKMVWVALGIFERPVAAGELVPVTDLSEAEVRAILNTLKQYSIVGRSLDKDGYEIFSCLPLTLEFAKKESESWPGADEMRRRYRQYRALIVKAGIDKQGSEAARVLRETRVVQPAILARELARRALAHFREGDTAQANELIASAERIEPKERSIWDVRAEMQLAEGRYDEARDTLVRLLDLSPYDLATLKKLVYVEKVAREWDQAIEYGRRVTRLPGATKKDWHILGTMYYNRARVEKEKGNVLKKEESLLNAVECFRSAFIGNPCGLDEKRHNVIVCDTLARAYSYLRKHDDAADTIKRGLEIEPSNSILLQLQAQLLERTKAFGAH